MTKSAVLAANRAHSGFVQPTRPDPPPGAFDALAALFRVLAEPLRLRIIRAVENRGSISVSQIAEAIGASQPTVSKHLRILEDAGLIRKQPSGPVVLCSIADRDLVRLCEEICDRIQAGLQARASLVSLVRSAPR